MDVYVYRQSSKNKLTVVYFQLKWQDNGHMYLWSQWHDKRHTHTHTRTGKVEQTKSATVLVLSTVRTT